jgi:hypothetical protein
MTIGNLPKEIRRKPSRRAQILIGYLPTSRLETFPTAAGRRRALANVFHMCMGRILQPLKVAGVDGINMRSGDGVLRRTHPIFAIFVGDYPEQNLVCCTKNGRCPKCLIDPDSLGEDAKFPLRDLNAILDVLDTFDDDNPNPTAYAKACEGVGIKPVQHPFWEDLPYVNIFQSITSDVLHQLYQGVVKHLISWVTKACGAAEIDARCRRLPPNHNLRHFRKGITTLSRVSGKEHSDMCRILLGLIIDIRLPGGVSSTQFICAVRALLDFLYLAQFPTHTEETLRLLELSLTRFHENKSVFIDLGIRSDFNIPKLHSLQHYAAIIKLYGTTDNYNTEYSERLHIDFAKDAYRATNHKDEYPQMTLWLERKEKVLRHELFIQWRLQGQNPPMSDAPEMIHRTRIKMTRHPTVKSVHFETFQTEYGAADFRDELAKFVTRHNYGGDSRISAGQLHLIAQNIALPFRHLPAFHRIKFWIPDPHARSDIPETKDIAHVRPKQKEKKRGTWKPGRFDTVLVKIDSDADESNGIEGRIFPDFKGLLLIQFSGFRVAQVRAVFRIPDAVADRVFTNPDSEQPKHLAYIEWFTKFTPVPDADYDMYKISRAMQGNTGKRLASVIPVSDISSSVSLFPKPGAKIPREWTTDNVLELCKTFYVNPFSTHYSYFNDT